MGGGPPAVPEQSSPQAHAQRFESNSVQGTIITDGGQNQPVENVTDSRVNDWDVAAVASDTRDPFFEEHADGDEVLEKDWFSKHTHEYPDNHPFDEREYGPNQSGSDWEQLTSDADVTDSVSEQARDVQSSTGVGVDPSQFGESSSSSSLSESTDTDTGDSDSSRVGAAGLDINTLRDTQLVDEDGNILEEGHEILQSDATANAIATVENNYNPDYIVSIGSKVQELRATTSGEVNIHDPEVASKFTETEKEIIANWQFTGAESVDEYTDSDGRFMGATVFQHGSHTASDIESDFNDTGELIVATHSNQYAEEVTESIETVAAGRSNVDADELIDKVHDQQLMTHAETITRDSDSTVQEQVSDALSNVSRESKRTATKSITNTSASARDITTSEMEVLVEATTEAATITNEAAVTGEVANVLGYDVNHTLDYGSVTSSTTNSRQLQSVIPGESVALVGSSQSTATDSDTTLTVNADSDGHIYRQQNGEKRARTNVRAENLDVVRFDVTEDSAGELSATVTDSGSITSVAKTTKNKYAADLSRKTTGVSDSDDIVIKSIGKEVDAFNDPLKAQTSVSIQSPDDTNTPPTQESVLTREELIDSFDGEFRGDDGVQHFSLIEGDEGSSDNVKEQGTDAEVRVLNAISDDFDPSTVSEQDIDDAEENEFPDCARAMVEVKLRHVDNVSSVSLGQSRNPQSSEKLTQEDSLSDPLSQSPDSQWAEDNGTPENTRYVTVLYSGPEAVDESDISLEEQQEIIDRQPSVRHKVVNGDRNAEPARIEGVAIVSGQEVGDSVPEKHTFEADFD